jgi:cytochrome c556
MKHKVIAGVVALLIGGLTAQTFAAEGGGKPEDAIKYRQAVFTAVRWHFGPLAAMAKGTMPYNKEEAIRHADLLAALAKMPEEGFGPGTDKGDTKAKAEIWQNQEKFKNGMMQMEKETAKLAEVARSGDLNALKAQVGVTGKNCSSCHDDFKTKQK